MAKKKASFKSLPKRSKKAAFAKMSAAGKLKKKNKQGKRTGAAISAKGASTSKPKVTTKAKPKAKVTAKRSYQESWMEGKGSVSGTAKPRYQESRGKGVFFQIVDRPVRKRGDDPFEMRLIDKDKKVIKFIGTHPSLRGAMTYAKNKKR